LPDRLKEPALTTVHPLNAVLHAAADEVERWPSHKADYELRAGAGGAIFTLLFEQAKQMYGWTAIEHLQKRLGSALAHGQIQHWRETDRAAVVKALRDAAAESADEDVEAVTLRAKLSELHTRLADACGWPGLDVNTLATEVTHHMQRLEADCDRVAASLTNVERENAELREQLRAAGAAR
jgi:hypothetical protein